MYAWGQGAEEPWRTIIVYGNWQPPATAFAEHNKHAETRKAKNSIRVTEVIEWQAPADVIEVIDEVSEEREGEKQEEVQEQQEEADYEQQEEEEIQEQQEKVVERKPIPEHAVSLSDSSWTRKTARSAPARLASQMTSKWTIYSR